MAAVKSRCRKCGAKFEGRGALCLSCLANEPTMLDSAKRAMKAPAGRPASVSPGASRGSKEAAGGPVCPYCRAELSWQNMESTEIEVTIYVREKMYYCPSCRALLGFSSWHTEG
jgi:hypothetical protein